MPKVKISEYSATANSNTDVASINIDEGCAPSGINNAIRAVMGHLKDFQQGTNGDPFNGPVNGTLGATTASTAVVTTLTTSSTVTHNGGTANGVAYLDGSKVLTTGSALVFDGSNLGLGVTPSAWGSVWKSIDVGNSGGITSPGTNDMRVMANAYNNGTNWKYKNSTAASLFELNGGGFNWQIAGAGTAGNNITFTQAMTLDASGNLLVGTTAINRLGSGATGAAFQLATSTGAEVYLSTSDTASGAFVGAINFGTTGTSSATKRSALIGSVLTADSGTNVSGNLIFYTNNAGILDERMRIDSSGNLLVGKTALNLAVGTSIDANTSTGSGVRVVSSATTASADGFQMYSTGTSTYRFAVGFNGTISAVSTVISSISDARLKENVRDLNVGLSEIMALKPRLYDWKEGKGADIKNARGFIAQEFEIVFPDLIDESRDPAPEGEGPYKAVRADLIPVLVKAIQEQQAIIQSLTARITALEGA